MSDVAFRTKVLKLGFIEMVDAACHNVSTKLTQGLNDREKQGVKGLLCDAMTIAATVVVERKAEPIEIGNLFISKGINVSKLTKEQQVYCAGLKAAIARDSYKLALVAATTFSGAVAGGKAGIVAGGITGAVIGHPVTVAAGAYVGLAIGAGGPLLLGGYEMYQTVAEITNSAIDHHSQCGPLAMDKVAPTRTPMPLRPH